jgi:hypothetical protein
MKAISLWQPWATLVAIEAKRYETRHWSTSIRGRIAIHAAQRETRELRELVTLEPFRTALARAGYTAWEQLPRGAVVATADLRGTVRTDRVVHDVNLIEQSFGDFSTGRFAWLLTDVLRPLHPIPCRGAQGFFEIDDRLLELPAATRAVLPVQPPPTQRQLALFGVTP